jgi:hypothetical protein
MNPKKHKKTVFLKTKNAQIYIYIYLYLYRKPLGEVRHGRGTALIKTKTYFKKNASNPSGKLSNNY